MPMTVLKFTDDPVDQVAKALARALNASPAITAAPWRWETAAGPYRRAARAALQQIEEEGARS
jgi:hypothetical protein